MHNGLQISSTMKPVINQMQINHTHEVSVMVKDFGPLPLNTRQLIKLSACLVSEPLDVIKQQIINCLMDGITPSEIYQTIFITTDTIGLSKSMKALTIAQEALNEL